MKININIIACTAIIAFIACYGIKTIEKRDSYISTNGLSTRIVESDCAQMKITISNETDNIKEIQDKRQKDKKEVVALLKQNGIKENNIVNFDSSIEDQLRWTEHIQNKKKYKIVDNIYVKSNDVYLVKKISEMLSAEFMANGIIIDINIKYLYKGLEALRIKMIEDAMKDSKNRAQHLADVSSLKLIGLRNLHTGKFSIVAEDSSPIEDTDYSDGERSIKKRISVVVQGTFNIK